MATTQPESGDANRGSERRESGAEPTDRRATLAADAGEYEVTAPPRQRSLLLKHAVFVAALVMLTAGALGHFTYVSGRNFLRDQIHQRLTVVASDRAAMLESYAAQQLERVALVTNRPRLQQLVEQHINEGLPVEQFQKETRETLNEVMRDISGFVAVWITDAAGTVIGATDEQYLGWTFADDPDFLQSRKGRHLGVPHLIEGRYLTYVSAPLSGEADGPTGVVMVLLDASSLIELLSDRRGLGETGEVLVGTRRGDQIRYLVPPRDTPQGTDDLENAPSMAQAFRGARGAEVAVYNGVEVLAAYQPVAYQPAEFQQWGLVAKMDVQEAYAPVVQLRHRLFLLQGGFLLLGLAAAFWLSRRMTRPILRLARAASAIAAGNLEARAESTANDEIGLLVRSFNHMADELWRSRSELEQRVEERTRELSASEAKHRTILTTAHEAFVAIDESSIIREWNDEAAATFGWPVEEALGRSLPETIIPVRFRDAHRAGLQKFLETGTAPVLNRRLELTALHRDGHEFPIEITISAVPQGDNSFLFSAFVHDITQQKETESTLRRAKETADAASRAKSAFLANMSHEIRTPMNAIIGLTELMLGSRLTEMQREYASMIRESGESLLSVINDILDFSKIEAGRFLLELRDFDVRESVGDTLKSLAERAHRKGLELACHIDPTVPQFLVGDRLRLRQVIVNLVGNAIKFTDEGEVTVNVEKQSDADQEVVLHFAVHDTGVGIPPEKQRIIFEAFEQGDESMTRRFGGTGLGLAISSRLVDLMGGQIWLESEVGSGSTFHFTARLGNSTRKAERPAPPTLAALEGLRVLVVDDNTTNCRILEELLSNWGMRPRCVGGGVDALHELQAASAQGHPFELVLTDCHMPDLDGFSLAKRIQQQPELNGSLIMMLTSSDQADDAARCEQLGISVCLRKPIKQSELFEAIVKAVGTTAAASGRESASTAAETAPARRPLRVLLAEDNLINQKVALGMLNKEGHQVSVAANGHEVLRLLAAEKFDVVLMDVQMPEMDGLQATAAIRQKEQAIGGHVPIVAMTAHAMKGDRERCLEAGMDDYISKPVHARDLADVLARVTRDQPTGTGRMAEGGKQRAGERSRESGVGNREPEGGTPETEPRSALRAPRSGSLRPRERSAETVAAGSSGNGHRKDGEIIDWQAALELLEGRAAALADLAGLFRSECPKTLEEIHRAVENHDAPTLRRAAHTLKGSASVFHAEPVVETALELEEIGREGNLDAAPDALHTLDERVDRLLDEVDRFLQKGRNR